MKVNNKIELNDEVLNFLNITNTVKPTKNSIVYHFDLHHFQNIKIIAHKIKRMLGEYSFDFDEIYNKLLQQSVETIQTYLQNEAFKKIQFKLFFWTDLKYKTLNYFNSINNKQFRFERNLSNLNFNKNSLEEIRNHSINLNDKNEKEYLIQLIQKSKNKLSETEQEFIKSFLENKNNLYFTKIKQTQILQKIKSKLFC
ncbi:hypothetical protein [Mycoplasmopsis gallopavonis]|uniref:Uncharacterized protein n=1 Tax=Mycoplasmopsis gallopavonis TaxID=76629 RepID=A0A449AZB1_9BACT|nr:hypothetical protein [Mycoplasmopsis gallopavonis]RIV16955.1 hypothetical protein D1113_00215 [Mycoplasmopsis gallopavonis]VEU72796.1 Uncharacterised protein [Mycoplasmopsis gallopavonis]